MTTNAVDNIDCAVATNFIAKNVSSKDSVDDNTTKKDCGDGIVDGVENEFLIMFIQTPNRVIDASKNIKKFYKKNISSIVIDQISEKETEGGSGWTLHEIIGLTINNNKHQVFNGAVHLQLPNFIANKKAVINVQNNDNKCFRWAVLAALHPNVKRPNRLSNYIPFEDELNFENITFPMTLNQITLFEIQNEFISINVYAIEEEYNKNSRKNEKIIVPIRISDEIQSNHIHLLWISSVDTDNNCDDETENVCNIPLSEKVNNEQITSHYCFIKDLAKLIVSQCNSVKSKIWLCDRCLHYFYSEIKLETHKIACEGRNKCKISLPKKHSMERWKASKISIDNYLLHTSCTSTLNHY